MKKIVLAIVGVALVSSSLFTRAAIFSGGFVNGQRTYCAGSTISSSDVTLRVKPAGNQWNGISSKVSLTYDATTNAYGPTASIVIGYATSADPTYLGQTFWYKAWTGTSASLGGIDDRWVKSEIYIYTNNMTGADTNKYKGVICHELGHALSISHPEGFTDNLVYGDQTKLMNDSYQTHLLWPYDTDMLKKKWGN